MIEYALNNVSHKSIGDTPSCILFGVNQRSKSKDKVREYIENQRPNDRRETAIRSKAKNLLCKARENNKSYVNRRGEKNLTNILKAIL